MNVWDVKINSIVYHSVEAKVGVITGLARNLDQDDTFVEVKWDDMLYSLMEDPAFLMPVSAGRYAWVLSQRKKKRDEGENK